jgi:hypothetical protein
MKNVDLSKWDNFATEEKLKQINVLVTENQTLEPDTVMKAVDCTLDEAIQLMMILYNLFCADMYLTVWVGDKMVAKRELREGFPDLPFTTPDGVEITSQDQLGYSFQADIIQPVKFVAEKAWLDFMQYS